jgi:predicted porin
VAGGGAIVSSTMRAGNVSLRNSMGLLEIGTLQWSAGYAVSSKVGVFAEGFGGEAHAIMPARITGVSYTTPAMSGVTVTLQHGGAHGNRTSRESAADAADGFRANKEARTGINAQYNAGRLYLGAAYESTAINKGANAAATTNAYGGAVPVPAASVVLGSRTETAWTVAATYDFGFAQVRGMIAQSDNGAAAATKRSGNSVAVTVPMGALALGAAVSNWDSKTPTATTSDISGYQFNARYNLSKRTNAYLHYGTDKDDKAAATAQGKRTRTVAGVVHTF